MEYKKFAEFLRIESVEPMTGYAEVRTDKETESQQLSTIFFSLRTIPLNFSLRPNGSTPWCLTAL